jgi:hypothetical protein
VGLIGINDLVPRLSDNRTSVPDSKKAEIPGDFLSSSRACAKTWRWGRPGIYPGNKRNRTNAAFRPWGMLSINFTEILEFFRSLISP